MFAFGSTVYSFTGVIDATMLVDWFLFLFCDKWKNGFDDMQHFKRWTVLRKCEVGSMDREQIR